MKQGVLLIAICVAGCWSWSCPDPEPTELSIETYVPSGIITNIEGIIIYQVGSKVPNISTLIGIHDIFGLNIAKTNPFQIADDLAKGGYNVILPDFFDGQPWDIANGEPMNDENPVYKEWEEKNSWGISVEPKLRKLLNHLKNEGRTNFGIYGTSYGGHKVTLATAEFGNDFKVAASFTPAPIFMDQAASTKVPIFLVGWNSQFLDYADYCSVVEKNLGIDTCEYEEVNHGMPGFAGSEGDWTDNITKFDAESSINHFKKFLCVYLPPSK